MKTLKYIVLWLVILFSIAIWFGCSTQHEAKKEVTKKIITLIIDGSGSGHSRSSIPTISKQEILAFIDTIRSNGGGYLRIDYIDLDATNNLPFECVIPSLNTDTTKRTQILGETPASYQRYLEEASLLNEVFVQEQKKLATLKQQWSPEIDRVLKEAYRKKTKSEDYSDITGTMLSAFKFLGQTIFDKNSAKIVIALSDLEESLPKHRKKKANWVSQVPKNLKIIRVNATASGAMFKNITEVSSIENALQLVQ